MALRFFNTLSRSLQEFVPLDPGGRKVGLYCCGPTVYDLAHIGNWRTFVFGDLVRRYLEFKGYAVTHVTNVTDIEDKIIRKVRESKSSLGEYTAKYEKAFFEDLDVLNCRRPQHIPHATGHIPEIISLIDTLVRRGLAYQATDGSVYFSIQKYRGSGRTYGQLVKLNFDEMRVGERVKSDEYTKEAVGDFALWKARAPEDGDVFWPSPWGEGRPGWHIECSAMSMKILGPAFDLHLGGEDLVFPHHEDEIAQSEGAGLQPPGSRFVKYWLHGAHLLVEGRKMSKSLGNFFTLRDLLAKGFTGREIRHGLLTTHYRETLNFTLENLRGARSALAHIDECLGKLGEAAAEVGSSSASQSRPPARGADASLDLLSRFTAALDDDLNIAAGWGAVFEWVHETNRRIAGNLLTPAEAAAAMAAWEKVESVLGIGSPRAADTPAEIAALLEARLQARRVRDFQRADAIRDELKRKGWTVEDTPKGPKAKRI